LEEPVVTEETTTAWKCPKDGTAMEPLGRRMRGSAWRCPTCRGVFLDVEDVRRRRGGQLPSKWAPVVSSILLGLLMTAVVRRLLRSSKGSPSEPPA